MSATFSEGVVFGRRTVFCRLCQKTSAEGDAIGGCVHGRRRLMEVLSADLQRAAAASRESLDTVRALAAAEVSGRGE